MILATAAIAQASDRKILYARAGGTPLARCLGKNLSVSRVSEDAGAGNRAMSFAFTNTSGAPCTLKGYPGFALLDRRGRRLRGVRVIMSQATYFRSDETPQEVTLEPGKTAWFQIAYNAIQSSPRKCPVSTRVKITAPSTKRVFILRERLDPCQRKVTVTPVRNGLPE